MLFACYRRDEANDPETYIAAVVAVLGEYPRNVVIYVTDPRTGIAGQKTFLPSVAEVKQACDDAYNRILQAQERDQRIARQLAAREQEPLPEEIERRHKLADAWINRTDPRAQEITGQKPKQISLEQREALLDDARRVGASISGMKLSNAAKAALERTDP